MIGNVDKSLILSMGQKRHSGNIASSSSEDEFFIDEEDSETVDHFASKEQFGVKDYKNLNLASLTSEHFEDEYVDEYLDKYSVFESIKHYDQQISDPNASSRDASTNFSLKSSNESSVSKFGFIKNTNQNCNNFNFSSNSKNSNYYDFNSLKLKRNHKTAMSTTQISGSGHINPNKSYHIPKSEDVSAPIFSKCSTTSTKASHQLTPIKTTSNLMTVNTPTSYFNTHHNSTITNATFNTTTTSTSNSSRYFTISAAAGQKFRQILKRYVQ